jgi:hypothetical protein
LPDVVVECVDGEKSKQLVDLGIGSYVKLYNIKVILAIDSTHQPKYILTENSGIRSMQRAEEPDHGVEATDGIEAADQKQLRPPPQRWTCLTCNCLNYASKTVCFSCDLPRREGPSDLFGCSRDCSALLTATTRGNAPFALPERTLISRPMLEVRAAQSKKSKKQINRNAK